MTYDVPTLVSRVRVALDANQINDALISESDADTLSLDEIITANLTLAARSVLYSAPRHLLDSGLAFAGTIGWKGSTGDGAGVITLPDDFMRLVSFQMSDWIVPVTEPIDETSPLYLAQKSRFSPIRGNPERPVVAIIHRPAGLVLEFYSCKAGANVTLTTARYIPFPRIRNNGIDLPPKLVEPIVLHTAWLTALSVGQNDTAPSLKAMADDLLI